ncbi:PQQ-dependent sugar dehydrogenase [Kineococcus aurantiacus]|uniref:Glucose/arabinose dehydrogenase n=1 Tax=Kineococcus aurantiacus TaxID=37633 RepID=A0A7Y9J2I2_9ACTN|nr:glucose/arabinose dehydrogenase [Kineococcus aurantiacus]
MSRGPRALVPVALTGVLLVGCSNSAPGASSPSPTSATSSAEPAPTGGAAAPVPDPRAAAIGKPGTPVDIATGLDVPWGLAVLPDGTALVTLRDQARVVRLGPGVRDVLGTDGPDGEVPDVAPAGEGGLLGVAVSPAFTTDQHVFLYQTARDDNRVVRYTLVQNRLTQATPIVTGIPKNTTHNGGRLAFGPDGKLYVGTGDAQDRPSAQDVGSLGGKVLRVEADGSIPSDNPFQGSRTWSYGHRNVQGFGWDATGRMIASEFGQDTWDELNVIRPGGNYGWPEVEGPGDGGGEYVAPLQTWATADSSPSGVAVTPDAVYVAALRGQRLWRVPLNPDGPTGTPDAYLDGTLGRLRTVEVGPDGSLWVLTSNTFRGTPRQGDDRLVTVPLT